MLAAFSSLILDWTRNIKWIKPFTWYTFQYISKNKLYIEHKILNKSKKISFIRYRYYSGGLQLVTIIQIVPKA